MIRVHPRKFQNGNICWGLFYYQEGKFTSFFVLYNLLNCPFPICLTEQMLWRLRILWKPASDLWSSRQDNACLASVGREVDCEGRFLIQPSLPASHQGWPWAPLRAWLGLVRWQSRLCRRPITVARISQALTVLNRQSHRILWEIIALHQFQLLISVAANQHNQGLNSW